MIAGKIHRNDLAYILPLMVLLCIIFPSAARSQVVITGTVRDAASHLPLYLTTVLNKRSGEVILADSTGYYYINARNGDTLTYSFLGYYTRTYVVPSGLLRIIHDVELTSRSHTLTEVEIKALTPYQRDSLDRLETFKHYLDQPATHMVDLKSHSVYDVPNPNYNDAFGISLDPFTLFSRKNRKKRRFGKMFPKFEQEAFINSRYTPGLVHQLTGLTGDSLALFLYKFRPSYKFTRISTDLVFWSWIKIQYHSWIKPK